MLVLSFVLLRTWLSLNEDSSLEICNVPVLKCVTSFHRITTPSKHNHEATIHVRCSSQTLTGDQNSIWWKNNTLAYESLQVEVIHFCSNLLQISTVQQAHRNNKQSIGSLFPIRKFITRYSADTTKQTRIYRSRRKHRNNPCRIEIDQNLPIRFDWKRKRKIRDTGGYLRGPI